MWYVVAFFAGALLGALAALAWFALHYDFDDAGPADRKL